MRRVQILSPFRGATPAEQRRNVAYAQAALLDCLNRGEAPFAPHLLYPAVLDDSDPVQRAQGIEAGLEWLAVAEVVVAYTDLGISAGMTAELRAAEIAGIPVERRSLDGWAITPESALCDYWKPEIDRLRASLRGDDYVVMTADGPRLNPAFAGAREALERATGPFVRRAATPDSMAALRVALLREIEHQRPDLTCTPRIDSGGRVEIIWEYKKEGGSR